MTKAAACLTCVHCKKKYRAFFNTDREDEPIVCPHCEKEQDPLLAAALSAMVEAADLFSANRKDRSPDT